MRITPELQFLLLAARLMPARERLRELAARGIDWQAFLDLAAWHRVRPLVYKNLTTACWDVVPLDAQREWQRHAKALGQQALIDTGAFLRIAEAFGKEQIPLVALKGPMLAQELYGSFTLREFVDLDLLVRETDFPKAVATLEGLNYQSNWDVDPRTQLQFLKYQGESLLASTKHGPIVDLHWRVGSRNNALPLDVAFFWPRFRPVQFEGHNLLGFAPEDLALYLASQGGHDEWSELRRLCDLAALIQCSSKMKWDSVLEEADRRRGLPVVLLGLHLASELLDAPLPDALKDMVESDSRSAELAGQALAKIISRYPPDDFRRSLFQIQVKKHLCDKARVALGLLTDRTDHDSEWLMLPKPLWPLYRALRPVRQLKKLIQGRAL